MLNIQPAPVTNLSQINPSASHGTAQPPIPATQAGFGRAAPAAGYEATYRRLAPRLERIVQSTVPASSPVVEEACQIAWGRLLCADPPIPPRATLGWLRTTAVREALHALRAQRRELPLPDERDGGEVIELPAREPGPDRVAELRERLAEIHRLPVRQQRMVWLQGLGYDYAEIAADTGDTRRTVERQLLRAKRALRDSAA